MNAVAVVLVLGCGHISQVVKRHCFFKNLLLYFLAWITQPKDRVMMTKEGCNKIVHFMTPGAGFFVLGRGHINLIVKMHYSLKILSTSKHYFFLKHLLLSMDQTT